MRHSGGDLLLGALERGQQDRDEGLDLVRVVHELGHILDDARAVALGRGDRLVDDPYEVAAFVPVLLPALERAKEEVSDPECRDVCGKAHEQLSRTSSKPPVWKRIELAKVLATLEDLTPVSYTHLTLPTILLV